MTGNVVQVLLLEDSTTDALLLESELAEACIGPFALMRVAGLQEAFAQLQVRSFDLLLLDLGRSESQGIPTLKSIHEYYPEMPIVVLIGLNDPLLGMRALQAGAEDYVVKSESSELLRAICCAIERKRKKGARRASEEQLALAVAAAELSIYEWTIETGKIKWYFVPSSLFGLTSEEFPATFEELKRYIHPEDRKPVTDAIQRSVETNADFRHQYRVVWADGTVRWLEGRGKVFGNDQGMAVRMIGTIIDITQKKSAEESAEIREKVSARLSQAKLTPRELTLLKLIATGLPNKRIARHLKISVTTVAKHRAHLMAKTKALNAADLARMTAVAGLFTTA